jgi:hypothetical protein
LRKGARHADDAREDADERGHAIKILGLFHLLLPFWDQLNVFK